MKCALLYTYGAATAIYIACMWIWSDTTKDISSEERRRRKRRAARFTLVFPLWLPILFVELCMAIERLADIWPVPKKPKVAIELCPECHKKVERGPHR